MKLKIKVTKDILRQSMYCGLNGDVVTTSCAIALAVRDIFPNADVVHDYLMPFGVGGGDNIYHKQRKFIEEFDRLNPHHRTLMPELEFEIELSDKHISRINISDIHKSATLEVVV